MLQSCRYLSFCDHPTMNISLPSPVHPVILQGGSLTLEGCDPTQPTGFALLERLITQARTKEWTDYVDAELEPDIRSSDASEPRTRELLETLKSIDFALIAQRSKQLLEEGQLQFPQLHRGRDRQIIQAAQRIMTRQTVFLLPGYKSQIPADHPAIEEFSTHLYQSLESGNETLAVLRTTMRSAVLGPNIHDEVMQNLLMSTSSFALSLRRAKKPGPILLVGQTGTGKSMGAKQIARKLKKDFVALNLAAVTEDLLESRIRGHKKGAFTGATEDTPGVFELAEGKVLFLDELQSASLPAQTQLLDLLSAVSDRVTISRMGKEGEPRQLNVKLILAVNRPLVELLEEGKLRYDLYHRVRNIVNLPSLNQHFDGHDSQSQAKSHSATSSANGSYDNNLARLQLIRALFTIYRWNWQESIDIIGLFDKNSEITLPRLFLRISDEALTCISRFNWQGNFRQFERFSHDLFEEAQLRTSGEIDRAFIEFLLEEEHNREGCTVPVSAPSLRNPEQQKLDYVQRVIADNGYIIARCLDGLTHFKLKSRAALRAYLLQNEHALEPDIRNHTAIVSFLHGRNS